MNQPRVAVTVTLRAATSAASNTTALLNDDCNNTPGHQLTRPHSERHSAGDKRKTHRIDFSNGGKIVHNSHVSFHLDTFSQNEWYGTRGFFFVFFSSLLYIGKGESAPDQKQKRGA